MISTIKARIALIRGNWHDARDYTAQARVWERSRKRLANEAPRNQEDASSGVSRVSVMPSHLRAAVSSPIQRTKRT